ncbi:MAG: hypothetical protein ABI128_08300, partial [Rhodanobacter sp.]
MTRSDEPYWDGMSAGRPVVNGRRDAQRRGNGRALLPDWRRLPLIAVLLLAGCAVGPDFKPPAAPDTSDYSARPATRTVATADVTGGESQQFVRGDDIPADWWTLFHSPALDALIKQSLAHNPNLQAAQAALA